MEIPYTVSARRDTGLYNAKIGVWLFLASEVMLFGGLFSAYAFLRAGVREGMDIPWPNGLDVHGKLIWIGFANTLILILSGVLVVMAWLRLKLREYGAYQWCMVGVIACATLFMGLKGFEYHTKLHHHFGARLTDGTLVDGRLGYDQKNDCPGDFITFAAREAEFSLNPTGISRRPDPYFLAFARERDKRTVRLHPWEGKEEVRAVSGPGGEMVKLTTLQFVPGQGDGPEVALDQVPAVLGTERKRYAKQAEEHAEKTRRILQEAIRQTGDAESRSILRRELDAAKPAALPDRLRGSWLEPVVFQFQRKDVLHGRLLPGIVPFFRGNLLKGELVDDSIELVVHDLDLQMVRDPDQSLAWSYLGEEFRKGFGEYQKGVLERYRSWTAKGGKIPKDQLLLWRNAQARAGGTEQGGERGGNETHGTVVSIPGKDIRFSGSHGPKFNTYYATYFTMTALHGLHVLGGVVVFGYFLVFGKKLYQRNPEHLANRVEVGGLFWHFVEVIWIFLFPLMYLL